MALFWRGLFSAGMIKQFAAVHTVYEEAHGHFGLGVCIAEGGVYWHSGSDFGVSFHSVYIPQNDIAFTILANVEMDIWGFQRAVMDVF
ncbi:MAG: hypothetical protein FWC78_00910 [Defluviitaleaceae bacterium]|nr:hypothetical protein [Defluviitaleaceae bacterium]